MIEIHQFTNRMEEGDGVGNGAIYLQKILKSLGFVSYIYAKSISTTLKERVISYKKFNIKNKNQIIFIHYSIYYDFSEWIDKLDIKKIMIYHNITPYNFFKKDNPLYLECKKGIEYLPMLSNRVDGAIGDSIINSNELILHNFKNVDTIPILVDTLKILDTPWDYRLFDTIVEDFTIIFVGRIARNKAQHDLIEIANIYSNINDKFKMYIIGGTSDITYQQELQNLIDRYNLNSNVILTGKVSNKELYAYYRGANIFLSMSEHEGFGIPLVESMLFNTPVIAYNSSNIKNTLNGGGVLFNKKSYKYIASTIELIRTNNRFKRTIIDTQKKAIEIYQHNKVVNRLISYLKLFNIDINNSQNINSNKQDILFQFEGPYDSSYSLAILNRYSALAFEKKYPNQVSLFATEGGGDYKPNGIFLKNNPKIDKMAKLSTKAIDTKVVFRNLYPPRVTGMRGDLNILNSYGWEESAFPKEYIDKFNQNLDGVTVMSSYVKQVLIEAGLKIPIKIVGLGVEHILDFTPKRVKLKTDKKFKFLHISSCFPRKGIDVLLKAYTQTFTNIDDVTLIIKTFPNPHNNIEDEVKKIKGDKNSPEIILINKDLDESNIVWLYQNSNCLVSPSRGEGFGLPIAEAMLFNIPVITTAFGGQMDFCNYDNSWLIDYSFQKAKTHLNLFNSYWAEPSLDNLKKLLKEQPQISKEDIEKKTKRAYNLISKKFRWEDYRIKTEEFIEELIDEKVFKRDNKSIAWVSSYNTKCGIASYSEFLIDKLLEYGYNIKIYASKSNEIISKSREANTIRCWNNNSDKNSQKLINSIKNQNPKYIVINFNFGFFSIENLKNIIDTLYTTPITIIFHSTSDITIDGKVVSLKSIKSSLSKIKNILVHNIDDMNFFKEMGLSNIHLFPHGVKKYNNAISIKKDIKTIGCYGFLLPHKGILELIEAFAIVKEIISDVKLILVNALYPIPMSKEYYINCKERIKSLNLENSIEFYSDFLSDNDSFELLNRTDLIVMPYHNTKESSSAAVRYALTIKKPVLCSNQSIFNDIKDIVHFIDGEPTAENIALSLQKYITNPSICYSKIDIQSKWIEEYSWDNVTKKLLNLI